MKKNFFEKKNIVNGSLSGYRLSIEYFILFFLIIFFNTYLYEYSYLLDFNLNPLPQKKGFSNIINLIKENSDNNLKKKSQNFETSKLAFEIPSIKEDEGFTSEESIRIKVDNELAKSNLLENLKVKKVKQLTFKNNSNSSNFFDTKEFSEALNKSREKSRIELGKKILGKVELKNLIENSSIHVDFKKRILDNWNKYQPSQWSPVKIFKEGPLDEKVGRSVRFYRLLYDYRYSMVGYFFLWKFILYLISATAGDEELFKSVIKLYMESHKEEFLKSLDDKVGFSYLILDDVLNYAWSNPNWIFHNLGTNYLEGGNQYVKVEVLTRVINPDSLWVHGGPTKGTKWVNPPIMETANYSKFFPVQHFYLQDKCLENSILTDDLDSPLGYFGNRLETIWMKASDFRIMKLALKESKDNWILIGSKDGLYPILKENVNYQYSNYVFKNLPAGGTEIFPEQA